MRTGRYRVRAEWKSVSLGDRFLKEAVVEVRDGGSVLVHVDGEPLFEFATLSVFLAAHSIGVFDLVTIASAALPPRPGLHWARVRESPDASEADAELPRRVRAH